MNSYQIDTEKIVWRTIDEEAIILSLDSGHYYGLNKTGTFIWAAFLEKKTAQEIIKQLSLCYKITKQQAEKDLLEIITLLEKEGLISIR